MTGPVGATAPDSIAGMSVAAFACRGRDGHIRSNSRQQRWRLPGWDDTLQELLEVGRLRTRAAERVDGDADGDAAEGESEPDPESDAGAAGKVAAGRRRQVDKDRRDHEGRHRSQELDDCEHALEVGGGEGE